MIPKRQNSRLCAVASCTALFIVGALMLSACGSSGGASSSGDTLLVGSDLTYPPYASLENKKPAGFDPEIIKALAKEAGFKPTIKDVRFEQLIPSLGAGQIDVISSALYITKERARQVDYIPYFSTGNSIVTQTTASPITDARGLCGKRVAVIKGGDIVDRLRKDASGACVAAGAAKIDVREFTSDPEGTQALLSGQVDAQVTDAAVASTLKTATSGKVTVTSKDLLYPVQVGLALKKGNTKLRDKLHDALDAIKQNGTYDRLLKKYNLRPVDEQQVEALLGSD